MSMQKNHHGFGHHGANTLLLVRFNTNTPVYSEYIFERRLPPLNFFVLTGKSRVPDGHRFSWLHVLFSYRPFLLT